MSKLAVQIELCVRLCIHCSIRMMVSQLVQVDHVLTSKFAWFDFYVSCASYISTLHYNIKLLLLKFRVKNRPQLYSNQTAGTTSGGTGLWLFSFAVHKPVLMT